MAGIVDLKLCQEREGVVIKIIDGKPVEYVSLDCPADIIKIDKLATERTSDANVILFKRPEL